MHKSQTTDDLVMMMSDTCQQQLQCLETAKTLQASSSTTPASVVVEYGLTSHQTHSRSYRGRFYGSYDPANSVKALKDNSWSVHQVKGQSHHAKPSTR